MSRPFIIDAKAIRRVLDNALQKRYSTDLETYLADLKAGTAAEKYPNSTDIAELTRLL